MAGTGHPCAVIAIRARGAVLVAIAALAAAGCGGGGSLGQQSLVKRSEAVQSLAAEGALLAGDAAAGRSTGVFRRAHASELEQAAAAASASLAKARTTTALQPELRRLRVLAAAGAGLAGPPRARGSGRAARRSGAGSTTPRRRASRLGQAIG